MTNETLSGRRGSLDPSETTLICPENDLESRTIIKMCREKLPDLDIKVSTQSWGAKLKEEPPDTFKGLRRNVVIVEIPGPDKENELRKEGHKVFCIDHHCYSNLTRVADESSIEQIERLFDLELDREQQLIACNDRGYVYEMIKKLVNDLIDNGKDTIDVDKAAAEIREDISRIRDMDLKAQGVIEEGLKKAEKDYKSRHINFPNFTLVITDLRKSSPIADQHCIPDNEEIKKYISDRMQGIIDSETPPMIKSLVIVTKHEDGDPIKISLSGAECFMGTRFKLLLDCWKSAGKLRKFDFWHNGSIHKRENTKKNFFGGIEPIETDSDSIAEFNKLLDESFRVLLHDHPFLEKYSTVFVYPFALKNAEKINQNKTWREEFFKLSAMAKNEDRWQEYLYFHGYVREFLYSTNKSSTGDCMRFFTYTSLGKYNASLEIGFIDDLWRKRTLNYPLTHISIHMYFHDICLLVLQVNKDIDDSAVIKYNKRDKCTARRPEWRDFVEISKEGLFVEQTMAFNSFARTIYQSFKEQHDEHKLPLYTKLEAGGEPISDKFDEAEWSESLCKDKDVKPCSPIRKLVESFCSGKEKDGTKNYRGILDDRMFVHTYFCFSNYFSLDEKSMRRLLSRILYVDAYGYNDRNGFSYVYEDNFIENLMKPFLYKRFSHYGTLYGFSRFSSVFTMFSGYTSKKVLSRHFDSMYYQMSLLALYYRSVLVKFSKEIGEATSHFIKERESKARKSFKKLREAFLQFANRYWFRELTHQDQGIEIFNLQRHALGLEEMFEQVTSEVEKTDEFLENKSISKIETRSSRLSIIAGLIAILALIIGFYSMQPAFLEDGAQYLCRVWQTWPGKGILVMLAAAVVTIILIIITIILLFISKLRKNR